MSYQERLAIIVSEASLLVTGIEEKWSVTVRGPVMDVVPALYQRRGAEGLEVTGDAGLLAKFLDAMRF
ncbi:hypothetical protein ACIRG5_11185 [Lentzea sp. NPDC102401]|uniref:hypothetical protein n=1 Tax=Lentzea sp. NPDC102401 TaxID=3364128 RepID=UPI0037F99520